MVTDVNYLGFNQMAFHPTMGLAVGRCMQWLKNRPNLTALEFGNQRFRMTPDNLKQVSAWTGSSFNFPTDSQEYSDSTYSYFEQLGFKKYLAVDLNTKMRAVVMDLNKICKTEYGFTEQFDMVTNNGTGEHIFDQRVVFENMHNMTKVGGVILNVMPMIPWLNHGFYNYHPVLFRDIAYANDYKWCFLWIGTNLGKYKEFDLTGDIWAEIPRSDPMWKRPYSSMEKYVYEDLWNHGNVSLVTAYVKTKDEPFKVPLQGKWIHNIETAELATEYNQPDTWNKYHS
jgi:SAM-dependent methyltransferase